jgi:mannose-6-phosphate isomerase-like protein (cupin superfamily)
MLIFDKKTSPQGRYDGFHTWLLVGESNSGSRAVSIQITEVKPGKMQYIHAHPQEQCYYIIQGKGIMIINEEERAVKKGDAVFIPSHSEHGIKNTGKTILHYLTANPGFGQEREKQLWPENQTV